MPKLVVKVVAPGVIAIQHENSRRPISFLCKSNEHKNGAVTKGYKVLPVSVSGANAKKLLDLGLGEYKDIRDKALEILKDEPAIEKVVVQPNHPSAIRPPTNHSSLTAMCRTGNK